MQSRHLTISTDKTLMNGNERHQGSLHPFDLKVSHYSLSIDLLAVYNSIGFIHFGSWRDLSICYKKIALGYRCNFWTKIRKNLQDYSEKEVIADKVIWNLTNSSKSKYIFEKFPINLVVNVVYQVIIKKFNPNIINPSLFWTPNSAF